MCCRNIVEAIPFIIGISLFMLIFCIFLCWNRKSANRYSYASKRPAVSSGESSMNNTDYCVVNCNYDSSTQ